MYHLIGIKRHFRWDLGFKLTLSPFFRFDWSYFEKIKIPRSFHKRRALLPQLPKSTNAPGQSPLRFRRPCLQPHWNGFVGGILPSPHTVFYDSDINWERKKQQFNETLCWIYITHFNIRTTKWINVRLTLHLFHPVLWLPNINKTFLIYHISLVGFNQQ